MKNLLSPQAMKNKEVISLTPYNITLQFIYFYIRTGEITCLFHIRMYHTGEKLICCKFFHSFYADITESMISGASVSIVDSIFQENLGAFSVSPIGFSLYSVQKKI